MNPRRMVVEDRALALAGAVESEGHAAVAARIRGAVPETFGCCDQHVPLIRDALARVIDSVPSHAAAAEQILAALDDLPRFIGKRGRVWIGVNGDSTFSAHWEDADWLEQGPQQVPLEAALAWAAQRSDDVRRNDG